MTSKLDAAAKNNELLASLDQIKGQGRRGDGAANPDRLVVRQ
jgi:hypothetical protein